MSLNLQLLESSFSQVKDRGTEFADTFYAILFQDYPIVRPLFTNPDMAEQKKKLFKSLEFVVESLRKPDVLTNTLSGLGTRHVKYGVLAEHYPMVGGALLKTFAHYLQEAWTPSIEQAWVDAYTAVAELMLAGAENSK